MDDRAYLALALCDALEQAEIPYCVVGDSRGYLEAIESDLDLVVSQEAFQKIPRLLARFCREQDVRLVQWIQHEQTAIYFVLVWTDTAGKPCYLALDVCSDYYRAGRRLLAADEILAGRRLELDGAGEPKGFYVPSPAVQFIYYLLKKIDKGNLEDHHGEYLSERWRQDPDRARVLLERFWLTGGNAQRLACAAESNDWSAVRGDLPALRRALHRAVPRSFASMLGELHRKVVRVLQPTGALVVFLGPDGSGKSSVIEQVLADLAPAFRKTYRFHLRPRALGSGNTTFARVTTPHASPPRGTLGSAAKLLYLALDHLVGYALVVRSLITRSTLVVFDRYYHDLLVDPGRYRHGGRLTLARWLARLVPRPDLWVLLDVPAEVAQARKAEVPAAESARQRRAYIELTARLANAIVIDAAQALPTVVADAEAAVLDVLERRVERRHATVQLFRNPVTTRLLLFFCRHKVPVLSKLLRVVFNSDIYCRIDSPIHMPHPYGIVIHSKAVIGKRVTIMQQVTIGGKNLDENAAPVIEDDVYIGAGARILGGVRIGRGATVGANAVVTRDVPPYVTVVGANRILDPDPPPLGRDVERAAPLAPSKAFGS
ncbi:DapH/DapD/GlmU-related protein [Pelomicrobium sp.]|jgi:serine acetyltransferase|uniref:DapH/DapD/GlmU-related protein n=1 Tax=Pelomicrobium sp. TaxID=2815319 RepID=UPI002FDD3375